ncbi:MAG: MBL fold metallo-hydrolase [Bacteroidales bacterium]
MKSKVLIIIPKMKYIKVTIRIRISRKSLLSAIERFSVLLLPLTFLLSGCTDPWQEISDHVSIMKGHVNGVQISKNGNRLVVYGDPSGESEKTDYVLFTHNHRELIETGRKLVVNGARTVAPAGEAGNIEQPDRFWKTYIEKREGYFGGMMTNRAIKSMEVAEKVRGDDQISWQGLNIKVLDTPGYAEDAVSYIVNIDGRKYAFVGDLIYDKGQIADIYNLQSAVESTSLGRYHGYLGRLGQLISSLEKILAENPDVIIPSRGNPMYEPRKAIASLIEQLQELYKNYLAISSTRWYFGEDLDKLTDNARISLSEEDTSFFAEKLINEPPSWIKSFPVSRLIMSDKGSGFLIDCGNNEVIKKIENMMREGKLTDLEGVFITHYHGDHVNRVNELVERFGCEVYANEILKEILEQPGAFNMPYTGIKPIQGINYVSDRETMQWHEFKMKFYDFPGQTLYHGAMRVSKKNENTDIFFIGDAFSPTGLDDYSTQNRNLLHKDTGYYKCLQILKDMNKKESPYFLINQHIQLPFWFSNEQIDVMTAKLNRRREILSALFPWKNVNFGIDPRWARLYPYQVKKKPGEKFEVTLRVMNHAEEKERFNLDMFLPEGFDLKSGSESISVEPLQEKELNLTLNTAEDIQPGLYVIPARIQHANGSLSMNTECCIEILE